MRIKTATRLAVEVLHASIPKWEIESCDKERKVSYRIDRILRKQNGELKQQLNHIEVLRIEALSDGVSVAAKVMCMLCPDRLWIQKKYGKPILIGYFKHILKDLGG